MARIVASETLRDFIPPNATPKAEELATRTNRLKLENAGKAGTTFSCRRGVGSGRSPLPLPRHCQPGRRDSETVPLLIDRSLLVNQ